ncbi:MAG: DUF58 domain-containing protein [Ferruginibacter sp.]|nr:DUF58 domain-containing protein [Bacteroidota bacterium]MBX2920375.1 DUF58 domain-containing protein [Ferruginibacter sp.]MCB0709369.1 DUF58 domain-containing protein [Chitinophagaceae bacterium]
MNLIKKYIGALYLTNRFYLSMALCIVLFIVSFFIPVLFTAIQILLLVLAVLCIIDYVFLFIIGKPPAAKRIMADRLSNGDENTIVLQVKNNMPFTVDMDIIDELPVQFQIRNWKQHFRLTANAQKQVTYKLRPVERGEYEFGRIIVYVSSLLGLLMRRHNIQAAQKVPVYPSYQQMRKYQLLSQTTIQTEQGNKRMRKIGHSMEFEQIKEYVRGDDVRSVNWKATARKGSLMVNNYTDERSQQVYCVIDKGRLMKMPFAGLTLLDYAINSTLVLANVCLQKQDKIGLITFANKMGSLLAADRKPIQRENILQLLYNQQTAFLESDFEMLYMQIRSRIKQRSLIVLYTNFESLSGLNRQLGYLRSIARHHLLMVVFFENTELHKLTKTEAKDIEDVYIKTIAEKFEFEKRLIVKELKKHGILSILTPPEKLTINAVNKYLELKARQAI